MKKILIITGEGFEDLEVFYPLYRLKEEGYDVVIASYKDKVTGKHGYEIKVHKKFNEINPNEFDALVLPGGRGPERVRFHREAIEIVKHFVTRNKPIAAICHGPQLLISAGAVKGKKLTSYYGIKDDLIAAGADWVDEAVVVDGNLVTSRYPDDLPSWMKRFIELLKQS